MSIMTETEKREQYARVLEHDGWQYQPAGWVMPGGFSKPLPLDSAFKVRTILAELDDTGFPEHRCGD